MAATLDWPLVVADVLSPSRTCLLSALAARRRRDQARSL